MAESLHGLRVRLQPEQHAVLAHLARNRVTASGSGRGGGIRRATQLLMVLVITVVLLGAGLIVLSRAGGVAQEPRWQEQLDRYLAYRASSAEGPATVLARSQAQQPSQFRSDLIAGSSDGVFLATRFGSDAEPVAFPPGDVWCVLIKRNDGLLEVTYVVQKVSLYYDTWLVNEGPVAPFTPQFLAALERIGCDLPVQQ